MRAVLNFTTVFGPLLRGVLDWGQIGESAVWPIAVAVFFSHETNFLHQVKDFTSELISRIQDFDWLSIGGFVELEIGC